MKPTSKLSHFCGFECLNAHANKMAKKAEQVRLKRERQERKERLDILNQTVPYWRPRADKAFQLFCRLRDVGKPCISCGRYDHEIKHDTTYRGKWDGGHYISKGAHGSEWVRYADDNCHAQCVQCNRDKSGNSVRYRQNLVERIGEYRVLLLEECREQPRFKWYDYKAVHDWYHNLNKILKKEIEEK